MIFKHLKHAVALLYPPVCLGCEASIDETHASEITESFADHWCDECWQRLPDFEPSGCPQCGSIIKRPKEFGDRCGLCREIKLHFGSAVALGNYQGLLKQLVLKMKHDMHEPIAHQLGRLLGHRMEKQNFIGDADCLVPVPIHWRRRFARGFHASQVIAEGVQATTGIKACHNLMRCVRLTEKQGTLAGQKRFSNVKDSFEMNALVSVKDAAIVLIDDVMTSGATLSELAKLLRKSGARSVRVAVLARGTGSRPTQL